MAFYSSALILTLFAVFTTVLQSPLASSQPDFLSPLLSPVIGNLCKSVGCGKGKCKISEKNDLAYECECEPGWRQTLSSNSTDFKFLPCVIPNCTFNYSCSEAAPSPQSPQTIPSDTSIFEPCRWANCGGGACNKTSALTHTCQCKEGYTNLFNNTAFPCFKECSTGGDCPNLGLPVSNRSTTPTPTVADSTSNNQACSQKHSILSHRMMLLAILVAILVL